MSNLITDSFNITVNGVTKNSLTDYGWALENRFDCIGQPVKQSSVVSVPFGKTYDLANALNGGEPYFVSRPITLKLGIKKYNENWRDYISDLRNTYEGRAVRIRFSLDPWTWSGTAYIQNVESTRQDCRFDLFIDADAYKRKQLESGYDSIEDVTLPITTNNTNGEISPILFTVGTTNGLTLNWTNYGIAKSYTISSPINEFAIPDLFAGLSENITMTATGTSTLVSFSYTTRSL